MENRRTFLKKSALIGAAAALPAMPAGCTISTIGANASLEPKKIGTAAVVWYSQTGNTQKCGRVLARAFEKRGITVIAGELREVERSTLTAVDLLVIGAPVFYYDVPGFVKESIQAVHMEYSNEKLIGFKAYLKKNNLAFELPPELKG